MDWHHYAMPFVPAVLYLWMVLHVDRMLRRVQTICTLPIQVQVLREARVCLWLTLLVMVGAGVAIVVRG